MSQSQGVFLIVFIKLSALVSTVVDLFALIFLTSFLDVMSFSRVLMALQGHMVQVIAAIMEFMFELEFSNFTLGVLVGFQAKNEM